MRHARGIGSVYQPTYIDKQTGERKKSAVWWISYYHRGKKHRESAGCSEDGHPLSHAAAMRLLKQRLGDVSRGRPVGPSVERTTFEDLASMLTADYKANEKRSIDRIEDALRHLREYFGETHAIEITSDRITAYVAHRQEASAANATINRELAALKRSFRLGEIAGKVASRPYVPMLREQNQRKGFFESDQFQAILSELPERLRPVAHTMYVTGWRVRSEILTRQKHHVDLNAGWLRLDPGETKDYREGRMFPLTPALREVLAAQLERTRAVEKETNQIIPWLFHRDGKQMKGFRKAWISACKRAGLAGRIPHDFRRTAVRNLERAGVPRSAAMAMVGHKTQSIYQRYAIADESMLKDGAVKLAALHLSDAQKKSEPKVVALAKK